MKRASIVAHSILPIFTYLVSSCGTPSQPMTPAAMESSPNPEAISSSSDPPTIASANTPAPVDVKDTPSSFTPSPSDAPEPVILESSLDQQSYAVAESPPLSPQIANPRLTMEEAMELVDQWLAVKSQIFAPPYDQSLASKYLAEPLLGQMTDQIHWLSSNKAYFTYSDQASRFNSLVTTSENTAILRAYVTEIRTLYVNGKVDPSQTSTKTQLYRYTLNRIGDQWKISDRQTISEEGEPLSFDLPPGQGK